MERGARARAAVVAAGVVVVFAIGALLAALPARAECGGALDALNNSPAGSLCGSPSPSPSPSPSDTPSPSPTPTPTQSLAPSSFPTFPPFSFSPPPQAFPPVTQPSDAQADQLRALQQQIAQLQQQQANQLFGGQFATAPGIAATPNGSDAGFLARAATLLLIGTGVAMWMWRARVRRWMVGG